MGPLNRGHDYVGGGRESFLREIEKRKERGESCGWGGFPGPGRIKAVWGKKAGRGDGRGRYCEKDL